jgi:hypothetical protein
MKYYSTILLALLFASCNNSSPETDKKNISPRRQVDSSCTNTRVITTDIDTIDILQCGSYNTRNGEIEKFSQDLLLVISERNSEYVVSAKLEAIDGKLEIHSINDPKNIISAQFGGDARKWADKMVSVIRR